MNKWNLKFFIFGLLIGSWLMFCIFKLPELQLEQRQKTQAQEPPLVTVLPQESEPKIITPPVEVVEESVIEEQIDYPKYTDPDLILLAQLIEAEGGIESYQCKLYIGSVVLNRMMHDDFPDGLKDVIFQVTDNEVHQFSVTRVRKDGTRAIDCEPSEESLNAAAELLTYGTQLPQDVVVFYTEGCDSSWVNTRATHTQVDHTIFAFSYAK